MLNIDEIILQQAFTIRQRDLVNPELVYVPIVCVCGEKGRKEGWKVEKKELVSVRAFKHKEKRALVLKYNY